MSVPDRPSPSWFYVVADAAARRALAVFSSRAAAEAYLTGLPDDDAWLLQRVPRSKHRPPYRLARATDGNAVPWDLLLLADPSRRQVASYLGCQDGEVWLVQTEDEGVTIGVGVWCPMADDTAEIKNVAIEPAWQGCGLGTALVRHLVERIRERGFRRVEIGTGNSSLAQLGLYQRLGFRIVGVDRDFFMRHYDAPLEEDGIPCRDMVRLARDLP
jgi:ribosomal protein S18 acetylase RimI-like enzyme